jgi:Ca2+-binding EF-hand superfamily protein
MGAITSQFETLVLPRETAGFAKWRLADVGELKNRFQKHIRGYSAVMDQFVGVISFRQALHDDVSLESIFKVLDKDGDGRIDGLQFMAGVALCCRATFDEKVKFCFELFDFNLNAQLSEQEMVMMMQCSVWGLQSLTGASGDLDFEDFEKLGRAAILSFDMDASGNINYEEFTEWARKNRDIMGCMDKLKKMSLEACGGEEYSGSDESADECETDDDEFMAQEKQLGVVARRQHRPPKRLGRDCSWRGFLVEPTNWTSELSSEDSPESNLVLDCVHGFRCSDARSNLKFVKLKSDSDDDRSSSSSSSS